MMKTNLMKMNIYIKSIVLLLMLFSPVAYLDAQYQVYDLWKDSIPQSIKAPSKEIVETRANGSRRISGVTRPELWFFKAEGDGNKPAVVICPGGGYAILAFEHEGIQVAQWLNERGISAFVLKYRLPDARYMQNTSVGPLLDAQKAIAKVRKNADQFGINPKMIGIMGFSAGGHLAGCASTMFVNPVLPGAQSKEVRPDFSALIYPVISMEDDICHKGSRNHLLGEDFTSEMVKEFSLYNQVTNQTPTTFIVHAKDDKGVPVANSERYIQALEDHQVSYAKFFLEKGGHGFGMRKQSTDIWLDHFEEWLIQQKIIKE